MAWMGWAKRATKSEEHRRVAPEYLLAEYLEQISMVNTAEERFLALQALRDGKTPSPWMPFPTKLDEDVPGATDAALSPEVRAALQKYVQMCYTEPERVLTVEALNALFTAPERNALAPRLKSFMRPWFDANVRLWTWWFRTMPAMSDWCRVYVVGRDNAWLVKRAIFHVMPSGRAWLRGALASEMRAMPLRFEEAVFGVPLEKVDFAAFDSRLIQEAPRAEGATAVARAWTRVVAAMEVWLRESEYLHASQQLRWSLPFLDPWPKDRMLYGPMWLMALDRTGKKALRCAAIARLCVALSFAPMVSAWMMAVTNEAHNRQIEVWLKKKEQNHV